VANTYREVAAELFISVKTVETHVSAVLRKPSCQPARAVPLGRRAPLVTTRLVCCTAQRGWLSWCDDTI
jgi:DNA-binding NarL/FixJ family response regulator